MHIASLADTLQGLHLLRVMPTDLSDTQLPYHSHTAWRALNMSEDGGGGLQAWPVRVKGSVLSSGDG